MKAIETLHQFYDLMRSTIPVRKGLVERRLSGEPIASEAVQPLRDALAALQAIPRAGESQRVALDAQRSIGLDLGYEIGELATDVFFLEHDESAFDGYLGELHEGFEEQVQQGLEALSGTRFQALLTDRDGTVNNYCGRYASSVQSVYNAVFLTRFARSCAERSVILTSAPLDNVGLADISVTPPSVFVYAGSKGREYFDTRGQRRQFPVEREKQARLDELNARLRALVAQPQHEKFALIGSGLQHKFGQTTIARQDISRSVPEQESLAFKATIEAIVGEFDPDAGLFRIEDTGLDLELILTVGGDESGDSRDFDKGDGIRFLDGDIPLELSEGVCLVCGDTGSDVPMVAASSEIARETRSVFVTTKPELRERVLAISPGALFVDTPDVLVSILNRLGRRS